MFASCHDLTAYEAWNHNYFYTVSGDYVDDCRWGSTCTANKCSDLAPFCSTPNSTYKKEARSSVWFGGFYNPNQSEEFCTNPYNNGKCGYVGITNKNVLMYASWYCTTLAEADSVQNAQCANSDSLYKNSRSCFLSAEAANAYVDSIKSSYDIAPDMSFTSSISSISSYGVPACGTTYYCAYVYLDFCGSEFEKANTQKKKSECCKANYAPGNNSCVSPMALGGTGGFSTSGYLSSNFCSETYGSAATSKFCRDSVSGESSSSSGPASSSSAESGSSSSTERVSSSSEDEGSSSSMQTASSSSEGEESFSSMEIEGSSSELFSSSSIETISSSSENWESSSSADAMSSWYEQSSSSVGSGSDAGEHSSSSSGNLCPQHPLASVPASPLSACFSYGGKCYRCNPDRGGDCGNDWLWIYSFNSSNVGWWYEEVDCSTGAAAASSSSGVGECPSHPLRDVPSDPLKACFAKNGKCYKCNPDRGGDCGNDWLWMYDFNASNVGWWYTEVDCHDPFEEEGQCPDDATLYKKTIAQASEVSEENDSASVLKTSKVFYDVLGRKTVASPKTKRYLFQRNLKYQTAADINIWNEETPVYLKTSTIECGNNSKGEWICKEVSGESTLKKSGDDNCGILGVDYGIIDRDGSLTGGVTCPVLDVSAESGYSTDKTPLGSCKDGSYLWKVKFTIRTETDLVKNDPYSVYEGYVFPNGYITTKKDEEAMYYHELGHVKYYACVNFPNETYVVIEDCMCGSQIKGHLDTLAESFRKEIAEKNKNLLDDAAALFHQTYGTSGYAKTYTCPEN
ncbi:MAG: hypothetical protein M0P13_10535 [Fibrobacteraceae bacterium]|nr:hypothetical protein [Fibrobacteraceae bacterium]